MNDGQFYAENIKSEEVNVLFFHNTLPEYRIGWFEALSERVNVEFVFTNEKQNEKDHIGSFVKTGSKIQGVSTFETTQ